ncbi:hypothetical protein PMY56_08540 [Clostridium tertium]|jgi:hypothetical protein|uniref:hypothetical protein n=1 Tax=Clostridium TaxID=1485 RepID=UPI0018ABDACD|nr:MULTISPECIES: hypothetical protein [Clostridium]MBS5307155.1 hypothetical protein [Clostridium sp.]MBS6500726.1 hypothetical protein [Clostridium sp.]MDB1923033.1 hypothetical protein [Clostridium tertium]MDB1926186.1 hypothetical protein [Clostridium tertium]MDB1930819.1 hypothetical protein [Clostridium tertium]
MQKLNGIIKDFIKCIIIGSFISLAIILGVGISSLIISKFNWQQSLNIVRSGLLIIGPLGMILGAILILRKREEKEFLFIDQWKEKYSVFSYKIVLIIIGLIIILYGGAIDWIIMNFNIIN